MIELKTPKEIEAMKPAGRFVGGILRDLKEFTKVGTNLLEIDEFVHKRIVPYDYNLKDGDLVSLDLAINVDGWVADSAISFCVGTQHPDDLRLIKCTEEALAAGIEAAQPGNRLGDVSCAVGDVAREYGYPINLEFGGHGVGHIMHGDPHVPNDGRAHHGYKLREGLVIAIEPWFLKTTDEIFQDPKDGWTLKSEDGSRGAHSEHTIAITENGPVILTVRD